MRPPGPAGADACIVAAAASRCERFLPARISWTGKIQPARNNVPPPPAGRKTAARSLANLLTNIIVNRQGEFFRPSGAGLVCGGQLSHGSRHGLNSFAPLRGLILRKGTESSVQQDDPGSRFVPGPEGRQILAHRASRGTSIGVKSFWSPGGAKDGGPQLGEPFDKHHRQWPGKPLSPLRGWVGLWRATVPWLTPNKR